MRLAYYKDADGDVSKLIVPTNLKDSFKEIEFSQENKTTIEDLIKTIIKESTLQKEDSVKVIAVDETVQKEPRVVTSALTDEQKRRNAAIKMAVNELGGTIGGSYYARGTYEGVTGTLRLDRYHDAYRKNQIIFDALATIEAVAAALSATTGDIRALFTYVVVSGIYKIASAGEAYNYTVKTTYRKYVDVKTLTPLSMYKEVWGTTVVGKSRTASTYDATPWRYKDKRIETRQYYTPDSPLPKTISYNSTHQTLIAYACKVYHQIK